MYTPADRENIERQLAATTDKIQWLIWFGLLIAGFLLGRVQ